MQSNRIVFPALDEAKKARLRIEEAAPNELSDAFYEEMVTHLDELLDRQLTALIVAVRAVQVKRETEKILAEAV